MTQITNRLYLLETKFPYNFFVEVSKDLPSYYISVVAIHKDSDTWSYINDLNILQDILLDFKIGVDDNNEELKESYTSVSHNWSYTEKEAKSVLDYLDSYFGPSNNYLELLKVLDEDFDEDWNSGTDWIYYDN